MDPVLIPISIFFAVWRSGADIVLDLLQVLDDDYSILRNLRALVWRKERQSNCQPKMYTTSTELVCAYDYDLWSELDGNTNEPTDMLGLDFLSQSSFCDSICSTKNLSSNETALWCSCWQYPEKTPMGWLGGDTASSREAPWQTVFELFSVWNPFGVEYEGDPVRCPLGPWF